MATSVTNGKGGVLSVTDTAQEVSIVSLPAKGVHNKDAMTLKIWNAGSNTVYAAVNCLAADASTGEPFYAESTAIPIPAGESFWFVGQPIKKFVVACTSGETSTANYGAF